MLNLINFGDAKIGENIFYGGDAGAKDAIVYDGDVYMLKYPKSTRDLINPQISYTTSPLSEYLGSEIFKLLGIPVHKTLLGIKNNKVVVACKDFTYNGTTLNSRLVPFNELKNSFMASDLESYSGTGSDTLLQEVLDTIEGQTTLQQLPGAKERFWDMFVTDAFIGNTDRNNGNWGILIDLKTGKTSLAPVYDNGNAFYNKKSLASMKTNLSDEKALQGDAYLSPLCTYKYKGLDNEGHRINPFKYIKARDNADCTKAVARFVEAVNMTAIEDLINNIPENTGNLAVMPAIQKEYYLKLMHLRLNDIFIPTAD